MFLLSIFDRLREKLYFIDFRKFTELVGISVMGSEILKFLRAPFEECLETRPGSFSVQEDFESAANKHKETSSTLLKLLD